jgi:hypothetical protein
MGRLDGDLKHIQSLEANLLNLQDVDTAKHTILLQPERGDEEGRKVAKDVRVFIKGKEGKLADLMAPAEAWLTLSLDRQHVLAIQTPLPLRQ